jgi:hypothetical protein
MSLIEFKFDFKHANKTITSIFFKSLKYMYINICIVKIARKRESKQVYESIII